MIDPYLAMKHMEAGDSAIAEVIRLRAEVEALKKCCTQRGARMQRMREWMMYEPESGLSSDWEHFLIYRPAAEKWFDADGVPTRGEDK